MKVKINHTLFITLITWKNINYLKFIVPIVVYITTLIFLMIVDKIKMAAVIDR